MINPIAVIAIFISYMALLFGVALLAEKKVSFGKYLSNNPYIYTLSLAVYCTAWTYYGSVGKVATSWLLFLTIYLGPTLVFILWWTVLRKMVRIKTLYRITSIADFISARYNKSLAIATIATILAFFCIMPYIALQFKAIFSTFDIITAGVSAHAVSRTTDYFIVGLMIIFTIIFGIRRLAPAERHQGIIAAVAVESVVKLVAFLCVGIFVTYFMFKGFGDIFKQFSVSKLSSLMNNNGSGFNPMVLWNTYMLLSMSAILFLPHQFHLTVVENSDENHLRTSVWLFPLFMLLINLFVVPIALAGLLKGYSIFDADRFVLMLPLHYGKPWLVLLVFIGGVSAATSMIMISSMTMGTMITNHFILPLIDWIKWLGFLRKHLLKIRWISVAVFIMICYWFELLVGGSYMLVNIGMISFAAALQFAPVAIGGMFWRRGNKIGALMGLGSGFLVWFYTLLLPSFIHSISRSSSLLDQGPFGISFLRPEHLFGTMIGDSLVHTVLWSLFINIGFYVLGSLYFRSSKEEQALADEFVDALTTRKSIAGPFSKKYHIDIKNKKKLMKILFSRYFSSEKATALSDKIMSTMKLNRKKMISVIELEEIYSQAEKLLAGSIGAASAHKAIKESNIISDEETEELSSAYAEILAILKVSPEKLKRKINYYKEKEILLTKHALELQGKVRELKTQITERQRAEDKIRYISFHDKLTGLYNRSYFEEELVKLDTERQLPISLIMGDVNNLKLANDIFGHHEGDNLLNKIAEILKKACRSEDVIARIGGDEFVIIMPRTKKIAAIEVVKRIRKLCNEAPENSIKPDIALGFETKEKKEQDFSVVLKDAENKMYRNKLMLEKSRHSSFIASLERTLWERSSETEEHTKRLQIIVMEFGHVLGLSESDLDELVLLATLHDIGKIAVPDEILMKAGPLTQKEWEVMRKHTDTGFRIAQSHAALSVIAQSILSHHEKWDGTGYPQGLKGNNISLLARILSIADSYDVMTHSRPYKQAINKQEALEELKRYSGIQFDPDLIHVFIEKIAGKLKHLD
jgi:diguanylate cyclase (GGDEF)-like protein